MAFADAIVRPLNPTAASKFGGRLLMGAAQPRRIVIATYAMKTANVQRSHCAFDALSRPSAPSITRLQPARVHRPASTIVAATAPPTTLAAGAKATRVSVLLIVISSPTCVRRGPRHKPQPFGERREHRRSQLKRTPRTRVSGLRRNRQSWRSSRGLLWSLSRP